MRIADSAIEVVWTRECNACAELARLLDPHWRIWREFNIGDLDIRLEYQIYQVLEFEGAQSEESHEQPTARSE